MDDPFFNFAASLDGPDPDLLQAPVSSGSGILPPEMVWTPQGWNGLIPLGDGGDSKHHRQRKRELDRVYRERQKRGKEEMRSQLEILTKENSQLTDENRRLKLEAENMRGSLQAQAEQMKNLKDDLNRLKLEYDKQNALTQSLSDICAKSPHLQLENQRLRIENDLLKTVQPTQQPRIDELVQLKLENRILQVQNDALCGKILQDCNVHEQG